MKRVCLGVPRSGTNGDTVAERQLKVMMQLQAWTGVWIVAAACKRAVESDCKAAISFSEEHAIARN